MSLPSPPKRNGTRKSPYKHLVHTHHRKTPSKHVIRVTEYHRGRGKQLKVAQKTGILGSYTPNSPSSGSTRSYLGGEVGGKTYAFRTLNESLRVNAANIIGALDLGLDRIKKVPKVIRIRRLG